MKQSVKLFAVTEWLFLMGRVGSDALRISVADVTKQIISSAANAI